MPNTNAIFLRESQLITHPPEEMDWAAVAVKVVSCIPILGIICGVGLILEAERLRVIDPSLEGVADEMVLRGVACILGLGVFNIFCDLCKEPTPENRYAKLIQRQGFEKVEDLFAFAANPVEGETDPIKAAFVEFKKQHPDCTVESKAIIRELLLDGNNLSDLLAVWDSKVQKFLDLTEQKEAFFDWLVKNQTAGLDHLENLTGNLNDKALVEKVVAKTLTTDNWSTIDTFKSNCVLQQVEYKKLDHDTILDPLFMTLKSPKTCWYQPYGSSHEITKLLYHMVLNSSPVSFQFDGINPFVVARGVDQLLRNYVSESGSVKAAETLKSIESLENMYALFVESTLTGLKVGGTKYHGVLYDVSEQADGLYTLTLYNSGEGNSLIDYDKVGVTQYKDISYNKMELCLKQLNYYTNHCENFKWVLKFLDRWLGSSEVVSTHKVQLRGVCGYKCYAQYLHDKMGDTEWRKFKLWLTKELIDTLTSQDKAWLPMSEKEYELLLDASKTVFEKRKIKLLSRLLKRTES